MEKRILLIDFCSAHPLSFYQVQASAPWDLLLFDTTCLPAKSGRVRRVLAIALTAGIPVVLVRSHTKLDSLGIEYGRLGSAVFLMPTRNNKVFRREWFEKLTQETREAVRLFGAAAVPAHLPPFAGDAIFERLNVQRTAKIIRNTRRLAQRLGAMGILPRTYAHGLYITFSGMSHSDLDCAKAAAKMLAEHLQNAGLPVRHAGSFGFDFVAIDSFVDAAGRNTVRVAPADTPASIIDEIAYQIGRWWPTQIVPGMARKSA
ncbi:MAG TPA: hypothetical protein VKB08_01845 [Bradyrhizobium sp.]|nr:hypothetical protein [Bradyrhizobium sp.]